MCSRADERIKYIISECPKLAQRQYKRRHDWVGRRIHWEICRANGIHVNQNGMSINQKPSLRMTHVKYFGISLYRQTIL